MSKFVLGGSLEVSATVVTGAVFEGAHEWDTNSTLRYVQGDIKRAEKGDSLETLLFRVYDNSTGCLVRGTFEETA